MTADGWDFSAAITAGGQSRRFGRDKAAALLGGQPLLHWAAASLQQCPTRLLLGRAASLEGMLLTGWQAVPDQLPGQGPLPALLTALRLTPTPWLAFAGVDTPGLTPAYWELLAGARRAGADAVCIVTERGPQPLGALYHRRVLPALEAQVQAGERRLRVALGSSAVTVPQAAWQPIAPYAAHNVNTPANLAALADLLSAAHQP